MMLASCSSHSISSNGIPYYKPTTHFFLSRFVVLKAMLMAVQSSLSDISVFPPKNTLQLLKQAFAQTLSVRDSRYRRSLTTSHPIKHNALFQKHMSGVDVEHMQEDNEVIHEKLVKDVRELILNVNDDRFDDLIMVDALQRLGIDCHFEDEINLILERRHLQFINTDLFEHQNLYHVSLCFRILRQKRFHVSADVFKAFKSKEDKFEEKHKSDIRGLMELYEASQLCMEGEIILDEAAQFSSQMLQETVTFLDDDEARIVRCTLENPYHRSLRKFDLKNSNKDSHVPTLLELAELEFTMVQSRHTMELNQFSRWWNDLGLCQKLTFARDQPLKWYLWSMTALPNTNLSQQRIDLTKAVSFVYILDDIFDMYGTVDELFLLTEAVTRWDINAIEQLPYYMKSSFKAVYDSTNEIASKVYKLHGFNPINYLRNSWATLCSAFLVEAKWFFSGHIPKADEYLKNGMVSSGAHVVLVHVFFLLGDGTTKERASLIDDNHGIISSVAKILRLWDDLGSAQDENQDGHDGSYVKCFLEEHKDCSIEIAREHIINMISDACKCLNKECLSPSPFSENFANGAMNMARMVPLMYCYDDDSSLPLLEEYIKSMLRDCF